MGLQFSNTAIVEGQFENGALLLFLAILLLRLFTRVSGGL